jgi:chitinase
MEVTAGLRARFVALFILLTSLACLSLWPSLSQIQDRALVARQDANFFQLQSDEVLTSNRSIFAREDYSCSKDKPCSNHACCGKGGYCGYGPDYCGDGCQADCKATAECGKFASEKGKKCPLNVCCSEFGFCGTTEDFCNDKCQSNCDAPSLPTGQSSSSVREKVILYYEAW